MRVNLRDTEDGEKIFPSLTVARRKIGTNKLTDTLGQDKIFYRDPCHFLAGSVCWEMEAGRTARTRGCITNQTSRGPQPGWISPRNRQWLENAANWSEDCPASGACPQHVPERAVGRPCGEFGLRPMRV